MRASLACVALLIGCGPPPGDPTDAGGPGPAVDDPATDSAPWWSSDPDDLDGDGVTAAEGDCDDGDPTVSPAVARDRCDGRDSDCDGAVDEDFAGDAWEQPGPAPLGVLADQDERIVVAYAFPDGDTDTFRFYVPDPSFGFFSVEAWTYGAPAHVDLALSLRWTDDDGVARGVVAQVDAAGPGGVEVLDHGGLVGQNDAGWYELSVTARAGSDCALPYTVQILVGGL